MARGDIEHAGGPERGASAEGPEAMCPGARPPPPPAPPRGSGEGILGSWVRPRGGGGGGEPPPGTSQERQPRSSETRSRRRGVPGAEGEPARQRPRPGPPRAPACGPARPRGPRAGGPARCSPPAPGYLTAGGGPRPGAVRMRGPRPARLPGGALTGQVPAEAAPPVRPGLPRGGSGGAGGRGGAGPGVAASPVGSRPCFLLRRRPAPPARQVRGPRGACALRSGSSGLPPGAVRGPRWGQVAP